jgi:hypothetical protein
VEVNPMTSETAAATTMSNGPHKPTATTRGRRRPWRRHRPCAACRCWPCLCKDDRWSAWRWHSGLPRGDVAGQLSLFGNQEAPAPAPEPANGRGDQNDDDNQGGGDLRGDDADD